MGICGVFQVLGKLIHDPHGLEGDAGTMQGFALFDMETTLQPDKLLRNTQGTLAFNDATVIGYEIHAGITTYHTHYPPVIHLAHGHDGAISDDGLILGTYLHGIFASPHACDSLLAWAGLECQQTAPDYHALCDAAIDRLADCVDQYLDTTHLYRLLNLQPGIS
jgi:adenosylcobyric acid synthase